MDINITVLGQLVLAHLLAAAACTAWYSRRPNVHTSGGAFLVVFAWLIPIFGVLCLLVFLAALSSNRASEKRVAPPADSL